MHSSRAPLRALSDRDLDKPLRWECDCRTPATLLGTYTRAGRINIKSRDRYWNVEGRVWTLCPHCGTEHFLDLTQTQPAAS